MALEQFLTHWGLPAIFFGTIVEGEGVSFLGGVLAHRRLFPFEAAALAAAAGAWVADQAIFHAGRHAARIGPARRILAHPRAEGALSRLRRRPSLYAFLLRFLYGFRTIGALSLGAAGLPPLRFALIDLAAVLIWAHAMTAFGYGAGRAIEQAFGRLALHHHLGVAVLVALTAIGLASWLILRRRGA